MIRPLPASSRPSAQRGLALFIGMVFLVVLSLVAVIAMQSTFLEMRMVTNVARQTEAFQMSESTRAILTGPPATSLFAQSLSQGGWPSSWGGDIPDANFADIGNCVSKMNPIWGNCPLILGFETALIKAHGKPPKVLYGAFDSPGADGKTVENTADPDNWVTDATLTLADPNGTAGFIAASLSVVPDGGGVNTGTGAAQAAGYRGLGVGSAAGGASRYFQIRSVGLSPSNGSNGRAVTIAQFQAIVGQ
ncbi:MAG: hypothetical protein JSS21_04050 [Proteobacteria bacterium]|nr:hypothetical protein [Pseudomonadota bacterium]